MSSDASITIKHYRMGAVPESLRARLRWLSDGPDRGSMWRWCNYDGSTYIAVGYEDERCEPCDVVGWACLTHEEEPLPVMGVFVAPWARGQGYAPQIVKSLLEWVKLPAGSKVYAATDRWARWEDLLSDFDLRCQRWC